MNQLARTYGFHRRTIAHCLQKQRVPLHQFGLSLADFPPREARTPLALSSCLTVAAKTTLRPRRACYLSIQGAYRTT
jgi:hypothetical protein